MRKRRKTNGIEISLLEKQRKDYGNQERKGEKRDEWKSKSWRTTMK